MVEFKRQVLRASENVHAKEFQVNRVNFGMDVVKLIELMGGEKLIDFVTMEARSMPFNDLRFRFDFNSNPKDLDRLLLSIDVKQEGNWVTHLVHKAPFTLFFAEKRPPKLTNFALKIEADFMSVEF